MKNIIIYLLVLLLVACKKEKPVASGSILSGPEACADFSSVGTGQLEFLEDSVQFKLPVFNPQNQNEIVYNFINYATWPWTTQLIKYNLATKQKQILVNNIYLNSPPAWTDQGWLAFDNGGSEIYIMNSDGSNLTPFVVSEENYNPSWSKSDDAIVWVRVNSTTGVRSFLRKKINENYIDTLISPTTKTPIVSNSKILMVSAVNEFRYYDFNLTDHYEVDQFQTVPVQFEGNTKGMCWHPSKPVFYACKFHLANFGLYEINYLTGSHRKIMDFCDSKQYTHISCSPDGNYLIGQRLDCYQKIASNGTVTNNIVQNSSVYKIHIATGTETKINL